MGLSPKAHAGISSLLNAKTIVQAQGEACSLMRLPRECLTRSRRPCSLSYSAVRPQTTRVIQSMTAVLSETTRVIKLTSAVSPTTGAIAPRTTASISATITSCYIAKFCAPISNCRRQSKPLRLAVKCGDCLANSAGRDLWGEWVCPGTR